MLDIRLERRAVVERDGDVHEYLTLVLANPESSSVSVGGTWVNFPTTDSESHVGAASDGLGGQATWDAGPLFGSCYVVALQLRGEVPALGERYVGAHIWRRQRVGAEQDEMAFDDPLLVEPLDALAPGRVDAEVTIVFPSITPGSEILAPGAQTITSRTATWEHPFASVGAKAVRARARAVPLPSSATRLDDVIARLHRLIGQDAAGEAIEVVEVSKLGDTIRAALAKWDLADVPKPPSLVEMTGGGSTERQRVLRATLGWSLAAREALVRASPAVRVSDDVGMVALHIAQQVRARLHAVVPGALVPEHCWEAIVKLLEFCRSWRQVGPATMGITSCPNEREFQDCVYRSLKLAGAKVERELPTGSGRADFLLHDLPLELKAAELGPEPMRAVGTYAQQAADYASTRGLAVGFLLVLDTADRRSERRHQPHLGREVRVDLVPARASVRETAGTIVVTAVVELCPPRPSDLRGSRYPAMPMDIRSVQTETVCK